MNIKYHLQSPWEGGTKVDIIGPGRMTKMAAKPLYGNQRTNGPVNVHLISGPTMSTETIFAKFEIAVK